MHTYLACFDITDDRSRRRVCAILEEYGLRVQRSVFEISIDSIGDLKKLKARLTKYLETGDDLRFYNLCAACRASSVNATNGRIADFPLAVIV